MLEGLFGALALLAAFKWPKGCKFSMRSTRDAVLALGLDMNKERFSLRDLHEGMNHEREHYDVTGCDMIKSARIALAHLRERPDYYRALRRYGL